MITSTALSGKSILVTRPVEQASGLSQLIRAAGGLPVAFPSLEIAPPSHPETLDDLLGRLEDFDLAIFISPTAVARAWERITAARGWPKKLRAAAVGQASARALTERGVRDVIAPAGQADTEALLALPALQEVVNKRIVIFRGEGGRELLAQTLAQHGALVEYAECYRRSRPDADIAPVLQLQENRKFSAIVVTSRESLVNLSEMLGAAWDSFKPVPVFVPHARIAEVAREMGMNSVHVALGGDDGMMQAMIKFFQS